MAVKGKSGKIYADAVRGKSTSELFRMGYTSAEMNDIRTAQPQKIKAEWDLHPSDRRRMKRNHRRSSNHSQRHRKPRSSRRSRARVWRIATYAAVAVIVILLGYYNHELHKDDSVTYPPRVLELANVERARYGLAPLLDGGDTLQIAANIRAEELGDLFSHTRPNGTNCFTVLAEVGIVGYRTSAENIASGQGTPERVMEDWMNSEGHRANVLNPNLRYLCVGYKNNDWVQLFLG